MSSVDDLSVSVIKQPLWSNSINDDSFLAHSDLQSDPTSCSTPNINDAFTARYNVCKRKRFPAAAISCKLAKLEEVLDVGDYKTEENNNVVPQQDEVLVVSSDHSDDENEDTEDITVIEQPGFITIDETLDKTPCKDLHARSADLSTTMIEITSSDADETLKEVNPSSVVTISNQNPTSVEKVTEADATLLIMSSDEEEEDDGGIDVDTFIHLLDSPPPTPVAIVTSLDEVVTSSTDAPIATETSLCALESKKTPITTTVIEPVKQDKEKVLKQETKPGKTSTDKRIVKIQEVAKQNRHCRGFLLKTYLKKHLNSQQHPYPSWLAHARNNCTHDQLIELMNAIYVPQDSYWPLNDLSVKNYRQTMHFSGINPDRYHCNVYGDNDFYNVPPKASVKRFANLEKYVHKPPP